MLKRCTKVFFVCILLSTLIFTTVYAATFTNPISTSFQAPDPFVMKASNGYYYGMHTEMSGNSYKPILKLYRSNNLTNIFTSGTSKTIWTAPSSGWNSSNIWAPELHYINGVWYIYYAAGCRICCLYNTSSDPMSGTWVDCGRIGPDYWSVDATLIIQNNKFYLIYSGAPDSGTWQQNLYCVNISTPSGPMVGSPVLISSPTYSWEKRGTNGISNVNEAPWPYYRNGKTFIIYSASFCSTQYYCLGLLSISSTANPMVASNWTKKSTSIFSSGNGLYSTGHACTTVSPDGTEAWLVYHASTNSSTYQPRYYCMQKFTFNSDGSPNFGSPVKTPTVPSGQ